MAQAALHLHRLSSGALLARRSGHVRPRCIHSRSRSGLLPAVLVVLAWLSAVAPAQEPAAPPAPISTAVGPTIDVVPAGCSSCGTGGGLLSETLPPPVPGCDGCGGNCVPGRLTDCWPCDGKTV